MKTKDQIVHNAYQQFLNYGFKGLSMDDLARNMGRSKKTLYKYFHNKSDLINNVLEFFTVEQKTVLEKARKDSKNAIDELAIIYEYAVQAFSNIKETLVNDLHKYYPESWEKFLEYKNSYLLTTIEQNLKCGIKQGLYRKDLNAEIIARYYTCRIEDLRNPVVFPASVHSYNEIMNTVFFYHIRGIATPRGIQYLENEIKVNF